MADLAVRDLERAVAGGDPSARTPLAAAYLRGGRLRDALALAGAAEDSPELALFEREAWEKALAALRPTAKVSGARAPSVVVGWFGGARYAALRELGRPAVRVLDAERAVVLPQTLGDSTCVVTADAVLCRRNARIVSARPSDSGLEVEELALPTGLEPTSAPRDGRLVAMTRHLPAGRLRCDVHALPGGDVTRSLTGADVAFDWVRDRVAWISAGVLRFGSAAGPEPATTLNLEPRVAPGSRLHFLRDGRLLVLSRPVRLVDLDRGVANVVTERVWRPLRLSRDGEDLLCVAEAGPARVPLRGSARPPVYGSRRERTLWHPRADVVAWGGTESQAEVRSLRPGSARAHLLLRFPVGVVPRGWTDDGLGLVVGRRLGPDSELLELWKAA